jgi:NDP-sugar pyrophosphorylase family protein
VRAVVLSGGLGTRLQELLGNVPKAIAPFRGGPFLETQIEWLESLGVDEIRLALGAGATSVVESLAGRPEGAARLSWVVESTPLGTGGALRFAAAEENDTYLAVNGDTLAELDLAAMRALHRQSDAVVTLACYHVEDAGARGRVEIGDGGRVSGFQEKAGGGEAWVSGGVYLCEPALVAGIPEDRPCSLEREVFPLLLERGERISALECGGRFFDIGTPEGLEEAALGWRPTRTGKGS